MKVCPFNNITYNACCSVRLDMLLIVKSPGQLQ